MKLAIIGGISDYASLTKLEACKNDAETIKAFLLETKSYADICFLDGSTTGLVAKKNISDFIEKHRGNAVKELLFYFSGHGDRVEDDFFYAFSDFKSDRREVAGLRNTELDSLIRNISPELTVKIVDACYSGSTYIKSDDDISPVVQKSAKENQLKKLYFLHSSAADATSIAGPTYSWFTEAILTSLQSQVGTVRYRDLIAAVADEMNRKGGPRPTFVVQADSLETFVNMDSTLVALLSKALGLADPSLPTGGKEAVQPQQEESDNNTQPAVMRAPASLAELAKSRADDTYCTQEEAGRNIRLLCDIAVAQTWPEKIRDIFDIEARSKNPDEMPNQVAIARWIDKSKDESVFAEPVYVTEKYKVDEYKEMPRKPTKIGGIATAARLSTSTFRQLFGEPDNGEYKLETVEKTRQVLSGFQYTVDPIFPPHELHFVPKLASLEQYAVCVVCLFSRRLLTCLYSIEHLPYRAWGTTYYPQAAKWKQISVPLKAEAKVRGVVASIINEAVEFIEADARQRLS